MKHILTIFIFLFASSLCCAKIWRANNNPGINANFTTAQAAHDGAVAGDTIMFEPSATVYGNITLTKRLILIGPGYFVSQNNPNYPYANDAQISSVAFSSGSQNSVIMGLRVNQIAVETSNISILRNAPITIGGQAFFISLSTGISNINISQNHNTVVLASGACSNVLVTNNSLGYGTTAPTYFSNQQILFYNNIFLNSASCAFNGQLLANNIRVGNSALTFGAGTTLSNNIDASGTTNAVFGTTNGNLGNLTFAQVFVSSGSFDGQWRLRTGSPAIGAGIGGIDCGIFGGSTPYVLSGLPAIPALTRLFTTGTGSNTTPLQVTISIESKN